MVLEAQPLAPTLAPTLATPAPVESRPAERPAFAPAEPLLLGADEFFRGIYTRLGSSLDGCLAISSAIGGEGKSTIALGLATTIAQDFPERRVAVLEVDIRRPRLAAGLYLPVAPGLAECLRDGSPIQAAYRETRIPNLTLIPAGQPVPHVSRLLRSSAMAAAVERLRQDHAVVLLDLPALLGTSDAQEVAGLADGVLLVVRAGVTPGDAVDAAIDAVGEEQVVGVVLNDARSSVPAWLRRLLGF